MAAPYKIKRKDRASRPDLCPEVGEPAYYSRCDYGCAAEDSRNTGIDHISISATEAADFFFTIPKEDVENVS